MQKMQPFTRVGGSYLIIHRVSNILLFQIYSFGFYNTFYFVFVFFGAFTKYKSLALLLVLLAAVCIMQERQYENDCVILNSVSRPVNSTYKANQV